MGRTEAEAEAPVLWPPNGRTDSLENTLTLGKTEGKKREGVTEEQTIGWHHRLSRHEFEQTQGDMKDKEALCVTVHGAAKSQTRLSY